MKGHIYSEKLNEKCTQLTTERESLKLKQNCVTTIQKLYPWITTLINLEGKVLSFQYNCYEYSMNMQNGDKNVFQVTMFIEWGLMSRYQRVKASDHASTVLTLT